jgi:hypothetical protein
MNGSHQKGIAVEKNQIKAGFEHKFRIFLNLGKFLEKKVVDDNHQSSHGDTLLPYKAHNARRRPRNNMDRISYLNPPSNFYRIAVPSNQ